MDKQELLSKLKTIDEVLLVELLELTSEEIVDAFYDKIEEKEQYIWSQISE